MASSRVGAFTSLLRWLGPWTADARAPLGVRVERWVIRPGRLHGLRAARAGIRHDASEPGVLDAYVYFPRGNALGSFVISPGLHFAGPDDPRFDRFCRVLAGSGFVVVGPFVPAYVDLRVLPEAIDDFERVVEATALRFSSLGRPTIFSISFGSLLALEVAARRPELVDSVITFGGYASFEEVCRFSAGGRVRTESGVIQLPNDPLNRPALFLNLLPFLEVAGDTHALEHALARICHHTWGRMELKAEGRLAPFVGSVEAIVPRPQRDFFRVACGMEPGATELVEEALARGGESLRYASPERALSEIGRPVVVCHARDDDVIPYAEAIELARALGARVPARLLLTGLYGHSGQGTVSPRGLAAEATALLSIARALAYGGALGELLEGAR